MAYRPLHAQRFGPSVRACRGAYLYALGTLIFGALVFYGYSAPRGTWLYQVVVENSNHAMPPTWFALFVLASGLAAVFQAHMRGVILHPDGIEMFEFITLGVPRVRRFDWPVIDRFRFDLRSSVALDLWDGTHAFLPEVSDRDGLVRALAYVAMARAIPYTGDPDVEPLD